MAYVEWHGTIRNHYKTDYLMLGLKIKRREAVGIIGMLSAWAIELRPGGIIERKLIRVAVEWEGDGTTLLDALIQSGWLDEIDQNTVKIHDWEVITRGYRKARIDAENKRLARAGSAPEARSPRAETGTAPRSDLSGADLSGAEQSREKASPSAPPKTAASDLLLELVKIWNDGMKSEEFIRATPKRKAKIEARLKDFTAEQIKDVVTRCRKSEWHRGGNERGWKAPGPEWVLHTTERVEEWLAKKIDPKSEAAGHQGNSKPCGRCEGKGMLACKVENRFTGKEDDAMSTCDVCKGRGKVPA